MLFDYKEKMNKKNHINPALTCKGGFLKMFCDNGYFLRTTARRIRSDSITFGVAAIIIRLIVTATNIIGN